MGITEIYYLASCIILIVSSTGSCNGHSENQNVFKETDRVLDLVIKAFISQRNALGKAKEILDANNPVDNAYGLIINHLDNTLGICVEGIGQFNVEKIGRKNGSNQIRQSVSAYYIALKRLPPVAEEIVSLTNKATSKAQSLKGLERYNFYASLARDLNQYSVDLQGILDNFTVGVKIINSGLNNRVITRWDSRFINAGFNRITIDFAGKMKRNADALSQLVSSRSQY